MDEISGEIEQRTQSIDASFSRIPLEEDERLSVNT
jgi:hypothetical protein